MLKNYIKVALRNLAKQKGLTVINIAGLSIGLACFMLFLLYAVNEFSFDRFHTNAKNIFRVYRWVEAKEGEEAKGSSYMPMPLGPAMKQDLPGVQDFVRIEEGGIESFVRADGKISRIKVSCADPQLFRVFSFNFLSGNPATALNDLHNIVLTEKKAIQLFGSTDVIGKTVEIKVEDTFEPFTVSAVAENIPANSTIQFNIMESWAYMETTRSGKHGVNNWNRSGFQTYVVLQPSSALPNESAKLASFRKKYYPGEEEEAKKSGLWKGGGSPVSFRLQPLANMHTDIKIGGGVAPVDPKNIWIVLAIAASLLLIACINFTTLAMGRSAGRAKEIGIRKVIGSNKKQLVFQFLTESVLLTIFSAAAALLIGKLLLPYFNRLSGRDIHFSLSRYPEMIWMLIALVAIVGLLAGSYPALVLSGFKPMDVLKSKVRISGSNFFTRALVTFQFILSIGLIISTVVVLQQLKFMQNKNPGFDKENVVMVDADGIEHTKKIFPVFKQALSKETNIVGVAGSELGLGNNYGWSQSGFSYNGKEKNVFEYFVDHEYLNLMGIQLIAGRNFDPAIASDTITSVIVNEAMVKDFGWTSQTAIGQELKGYQDNFSPVVIGVVKNFNFLSMSETVAPQMFHQFHDYAPYKFFVRIKPGDPQKSLASINRAWKTAVPDLPLKYDFLDESLNRFYKSESRWSNIAGWAGGISIFLACLGLFGLAALATINRTKEIGIRKVLGATVTGIINLLSKDFLKLILLALIIASPIAWYFMNKWLQGFANRVNIGWIVFAATGITVLLIAMLTISFEAIKAAVANPVKSLRTE